MSKKTEAAAEAAAEEKAEQRAEDRAAAKSLSVAEHEAAAFEGKSAEYIAAVKWQQTRFHKSLDAAVKIVDESGEKFPTPAQAAQEVVDPNSAKEAEALEGKSKEWVTFYQWQRTRYGKSVEDAARIASLEEKNQTATA